MPVEVPEPIRFTEDRVHAAYDADAAHQWWRALVQVDTVLQEFRAGFIGKSSPVHFWWGGFDLAVTRFSGRRAPERPGADAITREGYSHEVISAGFWPGGGAITEPAFYAYAAPEPAGFKEARVGPAAAFYSRGLQRVLVEVRRCAAGGIAHVKRCFSSCKRRTTPEPRSATGTAPNWNARRHAPPGGPRQ